MVTWTAYANPSHHGTAKFSFVSVNAEDEHGNRTVWYGKIISFLQIQVKVSDRKGKTRQERRNNFY